MHKLELLWAWEGKTENKYLLQSANGTNVLWIRPLGRVCISAVHSGLWYNLIRSCYQDIVMDCRCPWWGPSGWGYSHCAERGLISHWAPACALLGFSGSGPSLLQPPPPSTPPARSGMFYHIHQCCSPLWQVPSIHFSWVTTFNAEPSIPFSAWVGMPFVGLPSLLLAFITAPTNDGPEVTVPTLTSFTWVCTARVLGWRPFWAQQAAVTQEKLAESNRAGAFLRLLCEFPLGSPLLSEAQGNALWASFKL